MRNLSKLALLTFFSVFGFFYTSSVQAVMWRTLDASQFGRVIQVQGSNGFECNVQDVKEENGVTQVTCLVGDVVSGSYKPGETQVLSFPSGYNPAKPSTLRLGLMEAPPVVKGRQYLLFVTKGNFGNVLIGGKGNGFFQGTTLGDGKVGYFNGFNNLNLIPSSTSADYSSNSTVRSMLKSGTSALTIGEIKNVLGVH